jgi:hypothetical protein
MPGPGIRNYTYSSGSEPGLSGLYRGFPKYFRIDSADTLAYVKIYRGEARGHKKK